MLDLYAIPAIEAFRAETIAVRKKQSDDKFNQLMLDSAPYFEQAITQMHLAKDAGLDECSVMCDNREISEHLAKMFRDEGYRVDVKGKYFNIVWG